MLKKLELDFDYFLAQKKTGSSPAQITVQCQEYKDITKAAQSEGFKYWMTYKGAEIFDSGPRRYVSYGELGGVFLNFLNNEFIIFSDQPEFLHETSYLLILSRVGKQMDLDGYHRFHACSFGYQGEAFIFPGSSGAGKSTLFTHAMMDPDMTLYSDDTAIIDDLGRVMPFPIRVGTTSEIDSRIASKSSTSIYHLDRRVYGKKFLFSLKDYRSRIGPVCSKAFLVLPSKTKESQESLGPVVKIALVPSLFKYLVIGVGTPLVFEFFWERGSVDFYRKGVIFLRRVKAAMCLLVKAVPMKIKFSLNDVNNMNLIKAASRERSDQTD